jgi:hypothetical protein
MMIKYTTKNVVNIRRQNMSDVCPQCKSDEAYGMMGNWLQCLMCGYIDKNPSQEKDNQ